MWSVPITRIGRYEVKGRIGGGGMGTLYLARDTNPTTDRLVTVKLLRASLDTEDLRQRFVREAQALADLSHPNIVVIYDSGEFEGQPFIVMEYVRGETLAESVKRRAPMTLGQKLRHLAELCDGLAYAHEAGIIHRDIKPANLMVDVHGRLKILDFGVARVDTGLSGGEGLTLVNAQIGTPGYMSPEQIAGGPIDARTDLFAVGAVAYELVSYREAFPGTTEQVSSIPGLDPELAAIISSALEKDVQRRCQDAATLGRAFERVRARVGEEDRPPRPTPTPLPGVERRSRRERAADLAFQRAAASHQEGADGFARRSAMEALAEDPQHVEARRLLAELGYLRDVEPWLATPPARPVAPSGSPTAPVFIAPPPEERTVLWQPAARPPAAQPAVPAPPSIPPQGGDRTVLWQPVAAPRGADQKIGTEPILPAAAERTVLLQAPVPSGQEVGVGAAQGPTATSTTLPPSPATVPVAAPSARGPRQAASPPKAQAATKQKRVGAARTLSRTVLIVAAVIVVGVAAAAYRLLLWPSAGGPLLTITRPANGTIFSDEGIQCGTQGSACSMARPRDSAVQLRAVADPGFVFSGFTGDCASGGRTNMAAPRACGATFVKAGTPPPNPPPPPQEQLLIVDMPTGGTIDGNGIHCGTLGSDCSVNQPSGTLVTLTAQPDKGFTFGGFTGDCAPAGALTMSEARRCGATFVAAAASTPADYVLTIIRPSGGTLVGPGIKCGAVGSQCEARHPRGFAVTLGYEAEKGYRFAGFTGDCRAAGKTRMVAARRCGASFVKEAAPVPMPVLTIVRPSGGTLVAAGINCGTAGAQCSAEVAHGTSVVLKAQPDAGFKFVAFTGDCDAAGTAMMTTSRSCGATFAGVAAGTPAGGAKEWNTNLPNTRVTLTRSDTGMTVAFTGDSQFGGYTAVLKGSGDKFSGEARRPGCESPSKVALTANGPAVFVGQFELRACTGRGTNKIGLVLTEKR